MRREAGKMCSSCAFGPLARFAVMLLVAVPVCGHAQAAGDPSVLERNKKLVMDFYTTGFDHPDEMGAFLAEDFIQHNARLSDFNERKHMSGRTGFVAAVKSGVISSAIPHNRPVAVLMAERDLVTIAFQSARPVPDDPTKTYPAYTFDTYKIKDGLFVEHWDSTTLPVPAPVTAASVVPK